MRNKFVDLNNHLFASLERLNDEKLNGKQLEGEIQRGKAIAAISGKIIDAAKVTVQAAKLVRSGHVNKEDLPLLLENKKEEVG